MALQVIQNKNRNENEFQPHPGLVEKHRIFKEHPRSENDGSYSRRPGDDKPQLALHDKQLLGKNAFCRLIFAIGLGGVDE